MPSELVDDLPAGLARPVVVLLKFQNFIIVTASIIMFLTFGFVVIGRYGFSADLFAYEEWLLIICFWMFFMASAMGTYNKSHVTADLLGFMITDVKKLWLRNVIVEIIELFVTICIVYWSYLMLSDEISYYPNWQTTIALKNPVSCAAVRHLFWVPSDGSLQRTSPLCLAEKGCA